jgi:hypothetical protein
MNYKNKFEKIFVHDIEIAAFVIASIMVVTSITSYALNLKSEKSAPAPQRIERNPVSALLQDMNGDGINDIVLTHANGIKEVVLTSDN